MFVNPVYDSSFADPHVIQAGDTYYAYATTNGASFYPTLTSKDLVHWTEGPDAMPQLAEWVSGDTWAPEVLAREDGKYLMYYTAHAFDLDRQCVGLAISDAPGGPFVDRRDGPFICQPAQGGSIDASPFRDSDGRLYLQWKNDGNCCDKDTFIYSQQLSPDGTKLVGSAAKLVKQDASWEGALVEAPTMWKQGGKYYLFYSANAFYDETYAVGYATCRGPMGPCRDAPENPILSTTNLAAGPGHQSIIVDDDGETWMVYHAWHPDSVGSVYPGRVMWINKLVWKNGVPDVRGPTAQPQAVP